MNLEQIKNEYAVKESYRNWSDLLNWCHDGDENTSLNNHINNVMILAQKECLKRASKTSFNTLERIGLNDDFKKHVIKNSINNEINIIK